MKHNIQKADDLFESGDYTSALFVYSNILKQNPKNQDAQIGIILADMAMHENTVKAHTLFEYYTIVKENNSDEIATDMVNDLLAQNELDDMQNELDNIDGFLYSELLEILQANKENKKETFNKIMFSSKLIITSKQEFLDFIVLLLEHGLDHITLSYLDNFIITFGKKEALFDISKTLKNIK